MKKAAVIGVGFISEFHIKAYASMADVELCAVCDLDRNRAKAMAEKYHCKAYTDIRDMLDCEKPDLVSICLPTFLHAEYTCVALEAGAHVLCEKPMALTEEDCERMLQTAREQHRLLMIGQVVRYWPEYTALASKIAALGAPTYISTRRLQCSSRNGEHQAPNRNGGALFDLFVHDLDFVISLFDEIPEIEAVNGTKGAEGSWRRVNAVLRFSKGTVVQMEAANSMPPRFPFTVGLRAEYPGIALDYHFTTATNIGLNATSDSALLYFENGEVIPQAFEGDAQKIAFRNEIEAFVRGVESGICPVPVEKNYLTMQTLFRIQSILDQD